LSQVYCPALLRTDASVPNHPVTLRTPPLPEKGGENSPFPPLPRSARVKPGWGGSGDSARSAFRSPQEKDKGIPGPIATDTMVLVTNLLQSPPRKAPVPGGDANFELDGAEGGSQVAGDPRISHAARAEPIARHRSLPRRSVHRRASSLLRRRRPPRTPLRACPSGRSR